MRGEGLAVEVGAVDVYAGLMTSTDQQFDCYHE